MPAVKGIDITDIARPMIEKGRQLGIKEGRQEGQLEGSLRIALRLYKQGKNLKEIAELVELPLDFLKKELSKKKL